MVEGRLAGLSAAKSLGYDKDGRYEELKEDCLKQLNDLRSGPVGEKIRQGLKKLAG
jgi:sarcosine oxidase subunit alpha